MTGEKERLVFGGTEGEVHPEDAVINNTTTRYLVNHKNDSSIFIKSGLIDFHKSFKA